ncbi:CocE/NonD family hydrolase [Brevibacillus sp. SYP-B805]|uniref:CocE/NonD family hydrolase n=1 Tax=Brevibacillus sp. SYP-B805 TaxID=1578199 RepID=UPI0013EC4364|nr:CocE/NonD family hydrolase [Brevibacillus sp. SYP-B805]NGQ96518.1 CocE/NonD family hydrolase [Brevibacillus sp. SYP-B805]
MTSPDTATQEIRIERNIRIPMRDGVTLSADVYRPKADGRYPAIVVRTPYMKNTKAAHENGSYYASYGYAVVYVDVRGRCDSDGEFVPYFNEAQDGYDCIEWAAAQPWCTGDVGTMGGSYLARIQWLTALTKPPHLRAMICAVTPSDPFVEWPTGVPTPHHLCWLYMTSGRVMQNVDVIDWESIYWHLPLATMDELTGKPSAVWREELEHPYLDDWWKRICYQDKFDQIDLPVLHISGWYDDEQVGTPLNFAKMTREAASEKARRSQKLLMGPWTHQINTSAKIGDIDFGPQSLIDLKGYQRRWFDYWLKGMDNGIMQEPPVRIFVMGENRWRDEQEWPLARTEWTRFYLHSQGRANSRFGDGWLSTELPASGGEADADRYTYDPANPVPFITDMTSSQIGGPDDYAAIERRDDVLVYSTEPLPEEVEVTGPIKMELYAASSAVDTDFMVKLLDVWPNGYAQRLTDGMVRARFREGMDRPSLIEPGRIYKYEIDCWNTSHLFKKGHRIRVEIASSAFPKYDRNLNTGAPLGQSAEMAVAEQVIFHDPDHPSAIVLPLIPR